MHVGDAMYGLVSHRNGLDIYKTFIVHSGLNNTFI